MEGRILELMLQGFGVQQIANRLNATEQDVKDTLQEILRGLDLQSLVELRSRALSLPYDTVEEKTSRLLDMLKRP